jgi:hypothetical protein
MANLREVVKERGSSGRGKGGKSAWIKRRSFSSRATCGRVNFPLRKTRLKTLSAMLFSPLAFGFRNFVGGDYPHGINSNHFINDDDSQWDISSQLTTIAGPKKLRKDPMLPR